jgi:hypothetical protein
VFRIGTLLWFLLTEEDFQVNLTVTLLSFQPDWGSDGGEIEGRNVTVAPSDGEGLSGRNPLWSAIWQERTFI